MPDLITITDMQEVCGLNALVEERKVKAWIKEAHLRFEKHLGRALYAALQAAPSEQRFVDLMAEGKGFGKGFLCWTALHLAYPSLTAEADRGGVFTKGGDEYTSVTTGTLSMLRSTAEGVAAARQERLLMWLKDNRSTYQEIDTITGSEDRITERNAYPGGIVMRRTRSQRSYRG